MRKVNCKGDVFQLDVFNFETGAYDVVSTGPRDLLEGRVHMTRPKAWRIWNRTKRAERDRLLPPVSAIVKTTNHGRRFSRVHLTPARRSKDYEDYKV